MQNLSCLCISKLGINELIGLVRQEAFSQAGLNMVPIPKLKAKTVRCVEHLTVRILQVAESQDSFDSPATTAGQKIKHFRDNGF
ncbi:hypothetical protein DUI87_20026 [Hirundo rustica rustica]|uniref:Uncharacterized protein n=1 Tax=Hirundo rustica rustica TaxID=333673 RepID=A0A3M0JQ30_HIRRU|nr:hypothetical protein DUI87_20026 [Hirundo rustica rustica]